MVCCLFIIFIEFYQHFESDVYDLLHPHPTTKPKIQQRKRSTQYRHVATWQPSCFRIQHFSNSKFFLQEEEPLTLWSFGGEASVMGKDECKGIPYSSSHFCNPVRVGVFGGAVVVSGLADANDDDEGCRCSSSNRFR